MANVGEILRQARQEKGISLSQAEEDTKIRVKYLMALEEDNYAVIPGKAYVKGFLKIYSNYLGLNSEDIMMNFKSGSSDQEQPKEQKERKERITTGRKYPGPGKLNRRKANQKWRTYAFTFVLAIAAIATLVFVNGNWNQDRIAQEKDEPNQAQDEVAENNNPDTSDNNADNQAGNNGGAGNQPGNDGVAGGGEQPTNPEEEGEPQNIEGVQLVLRVKDQDCWVKVVADNRPIFTGTLTPGQEKSFEAKEKIGLVLGNAGAVEVTYNGQDLGALGPISKVVTKEFSKSM